MILIFYFQFISSNNLDLSPLISQINYLESNESECFYDTLYSNTLISNNIICLIRCTFKSINSTSIGGAIVLSLRNSFGQENLIINCSFSECCSNSGGSIYMNLQKKCTTKVLNTVFEQNSAYSAESSSGGAIYVISEIDSDLELFNCSFISNSAHSTTYSSNFGGALYIQSQTNFSLKAFKCLFECNTVYSQSTRSISDLGGSLYLKSNNRGYLKIDDSIFKSNSALDYGGSIYFSNYNYSIKKCKFLNNFLVIEKNAKYGASIYASSSNGTIEECFFSNNTIGPNGRLYGGAIAFSYTNCSFYLCNFTSNTAKAAYSNSYSYGGAICLILSSSEKHLKSNATIKNCSFIDNIAYSRDHSAYGGAVSLYSASNIIMTNFKSSTDLSGIFQDCLFDNNIASSKSMDSHGGAISFSSLSASTTIRYFRVANSTGKFYRCVFSNNRAHANSNDAFGGAISFLSSTYGKASISHSISSFINCTFINNCAQSDSTNAFGGAVSYPSSYFFYCLNTSGLFTHCIFNNNTAYSVSSISRGGAISFNSTIGSVQNCMFINNYAETFLSSYLVSGEPKSLGGALFLKTSNINFTECKFYNNIGLGNAPNHISTGKGGAMCCENTSIYVIKCEFLNNSLCNYGHKFDIDCYIEGGACFFSDSDVNLFECNFKNNSATLHASEITKFFSAKIYGGAISIHNKNNELDCTKCIFEENVVNIPDNQQREFAGAIYLTKGKIDNCNFKNNIAYNGGDINYEQSSYSFMSIKNCYFEYSNNYNIQQIRSLIFIDVNENISSPNLFIYNQVLMNISTILFDGIIKTNSVSKVVKFLFNHNCISPFIEENYKSDNFQIYNDNEIECQTINFVFQSDCDDNVDLPTKTEPIITQTEKVIAPTATLKTQTMTAITQTEHVITPTATLITQTMTAVTETDQIQTQTE